jgi:hypothetical protein
MGQLKLNVGDVVIVVHLGECGVFGVSGDFGVCGASWLVSVGRFKGPVRLVRRFEAPARLGLG